MAADKRAKKDGIINDNYQKLFKLKEDVYFGMTGIAEKGHKVLKQLMYNTHFSTTELIKLTNSMVKPSQKKLTIMIAGKNEEGNFFIWQKNNEGQTEIANVSVNNIAFSLNTNDNSELFNNHLTSELEAGKSIEEAIINTIKFASEKDDSISKDFHIVMNQSLHEKIDNKYEETNNLP
jgi:20S proteasome alpha/beta subunit